MPKGVFPRKPFTEEHKRNISKGKMGQMPPPQSAEQRKKASLRMMGDKNPSKRPEVKAKIRATLTGYKHTLEARKNMQKAQFKRIREGRHPHYKGGITPINRKIRGSMAYKLWREAVFERDNYTCVWCGARNGEGKAVVLNADHIKQFAYNIESRLSLENGRTLCVPCHRKTDTFKKKQTDKNK